MTDQPAWLIASRCEGKDRLTAEQAQAILKRWRRRKSVGEAYRCDCCGCWHVAGKRT